MSTASAAAPQWAREYETIYILRPDVSAEEAEKVAARIREVVERLSATLIKVDTWGKRRLAYTIGKHTRGVYVYVRYVGFSDIVAELERNLRLAEPVIRFQTVLLREMIDPSSVTVDPSEVEFDAIEETEDEPELTFAQRLGLEERTRREDFDDGSDGSNDDDLDDDSDSNDDSNSDDSNEGEDA